MTNLPEALWRLIKDEPFTRDEIGMSSASVLIFADKVLKIRPEDDETKTEYEMMRWLEGRLPAPQCLYHTIENGMDYLLMSRIDGQMACDPKLMADPFALTRMLADVLQQLWSVDIAQCPIRWDLDKKLSQAQWIVAHDLVDVDNVEPETFAPGGFRDPKHLLDWLMHNRPKEDLVLSHGDFCLPNVFFKNNRLSGLIDLGRCGIADKWQDIALCWRSLKHNYTGKYAETVYPDFDPDLLFDALNLKPDQEKLRYYILLDELF